MLPIYALLGLSAAVLAAQSPQSLGIDAYVEAQTEAALRGIFANSYSPESAYPGVIIASPATDTAESGKTGGQDYYFQWTRDSALTMKTIINQYASGDESLGPFIKAYIENERKIQQLDTLSGNFTSGGLAEPKFYVNSTVFYGEWGRPQRDCPALRATVIMAFLSLQNDTSYIQNVTETVVRPDLNYVATNWDELGFDVWEEQYNLHFFTSMVQARALREGAAFFTALGDNVTASNYLAQEQKISTLIDSFWNATGQTFDAQLNGTTSKSADCANMLATIHGSDAGAKYTPSSDKILASAATLIDQMTGLYPIDSRFNTSAVPIGRYTNDDYDGINTSQGNPWFLCNSAVAEVLHLAANEFTSAGSVAVTDINLDFFKKISTSVTSGTNLTSTNATAIISSIRKYADEFLAIEQMFVGSNFSMSEQFNRTTGARQGARDLTWSYTSFVTAARARSGQLSYNFVTGVAANVANMTDEDTLENTLSTEAAQNSTSVAVSDTKTTSSAASVSLSLALLGVAYVVVLY